MDILSGVLGQNSEINEEAIKDLYHDRILLLNTDITDAVLQDIIIHIMLFNKDDRDIPIDKRLPIKLLIDTEGGEIFSANNLIDVIGASKTPVWAIGQSLVASSGFSIFIKCDERYAYPHTSFLMHDGSTMVSNSGSKARDFMNFLDKIDDIGKELILERTKITEEEFDRKKRDEVFFLSEEAREKGIVDYIIGIDCDLDDIL